MSNWISDGLKWASISGVVLVLIGGGFILWVGKGYCTAAELRVEKRLDEELDAAEQKREEMQEVLNDSLADCRAEKSEAIACRTLEKNSQLVTIVEEPAPKNNWWPLF